MGWNQELDPTQSFNSNTTAPFWSLSSGPSTHIGQKTPMEYMRLYSFIGIAQTPSKWLRIDPCFGTMPIGEALQEIHVEIEDRMVMESGRDQSLAEARVVKCLSRQTPWGLVRHVPKQNART